MQAWQEEVERARQGQRDAESKLSSLEASIIIVHLYQDYFVFFCWLICGFIFSDLFVWLQAEVQKMRVEMAAMKRDAEHYSRQVTVKIDSPFN